MTLSLKYGTVVAAVAAVTAAEVENNAVRLTVHTETTVGALILIRQEELWRQIIHYTNI